MSKQSPKPDSSVRQLPWTLNQDHKRQSSERIYDSVMRGGGEPFGAPYEVGTSTLTEKIVKFFKQRGFFSFETIDKKNLQKRRNKFTRYGSARFMGEYPKKR